MAKQVTGNEAQFNEKVTFLKNVVVNQNVDVGSAVTINASTGKISANEISANQISANSFVGSGVTINSSGINVSGAVTATSFSGDGSLLTGVVAANNGVFVTKNNVLVGTPGIGVTIGLGTGLNGEQPSAGIVTVYLDAGLEELTDVSFSGLTATNVLSYNGTNWVNASAASIGSTIWSTAISGSLTHTFYNAGAVAIGTDGVGVSGYLENNLLLGKDSCITFDSGDIIINYDPNNFATNSFNINFHPPGQFGIRAKPVLNPTGLGNTANFVAAFGVGVVGRFAQGAQDNIIIGRVAANQITSACNNILFGQSAAANLTSGYSNIVVGTAAGIGIGTGSYNVFLGHQSGQNIAGKDYNTFLGSQTGYFTNGCSNVFIGEKAGLGNILDISGTIGYNNVYIGKCAGFCVRTGECNVALGHKAAGNIKDGNDNVILGTESGFGDPTNGFRGCLNVILGKCAGYNAIAADSNVIIGTSAAYHIESGDNNVAIGNASSCCLSNGCENTTIGYRAGRYLTTGDSNVLIGSSAGEGDTLGLQGYRNVFLGVYAGQRAYTGGSNVAVGSCAGRCLNSGSNNVALGHCAAYLLSSGCCNVAIGCDSGKYLSTGDRNVFIGQCAGNCTTSGCCNVMIGPITGSLTSGNFVNNNIAIGWWAGGDGNYGLHCLSGQSNKIVIGNCYITNFYTHMSAKSFPATTVKWCSVTNELAADTSSCRFKTNINPFLSGVEEILKLNSVEYNSIEDPDGPKEIGLIAEEVAETGLNQLVSYDGENQPISVSYDRMAALFINAIKELHQENQELKNEISLIKNHLDL